MDRGDIQHTPTVVHLSAIIVAGILVIIYLIYIICSIYPSPVELHEYSDIMQQFFKDPDYDDFMKVYNARTTLIHRTGRPVKFWIWGVSLSQPQFLSDVQRAEIAPWMREIERALRRAKTQPNPEILDCIWSLYFATGDQQYAEIVRRVAISPEDSPVRKAARWSYQDIMARDYNDPIFGTALDNEAEQTT